VDEYLGILQDGHVAGVCMAALHCTLGKTGAVMGIGGKERDVPDGLETSEGVGEIGGGGV